MVYENSLKLLLGASKKLTGKTFSLISLHGRSPDFSLIAFAFSAVSHRVAVTALLLDGHGFGLPQQKIPPSAKYGCCAPARYRCCWHYLRHLRGNLGGSRGYPASADQIHELAATHRRLGLLLD